MKLFLLATTFFFSGLTHAYSPLHDHGFAHLVFHEGAIHAHATWVEGPVVGKESMLRIDWKNGSDHSPYEPNGQFTASLWMPSMGHGSAPTQVQRINSNQGQSLSGVYLVRNIYFMMPGDWNLNITLTLPNGTQETQTIELHLESENDHDHGHHSH